MGVDGIVRIGYPSGFILTRGITMLNRPLLNPQYSFPLFSPSALLRYASSSAAHNKLTTSDLLVLKLAISGWLVARFNHHHNYSSLGERDRVRYFLFVSSWTTLLLPMMMIFFMFARNSFMASVLAHMILCVLFRSSIALSSLTLLLL